MLTMSEDDLESFATELEQDASVFEKELSEAEKAIYLQGKYDAENCLFEIHVGNGGDDAEDFVSMLIRMYLRYFESKGWKASIVDENRTEPGYKSIAIEVDGDNVYGLLKYEKGVHRLIRLSPFKSGQTRQTSFASVIVSPLFEHAPVEVQEKDLRVDTFRSSGAGGQKVNKTDSAVRITHIPTGLFVACQTERSQHQNKAKALQILTSKLFEIEEAKREAEDAKIKGPLQKAEFGSQMRTFTLQPYRLVKDHRTDYETSDTAGVLDGDLDGFIDAELRFFAKSS